MNKEKYKKISLLGLSSITIYAQQSVEPQPIAEEPVVEQQVTELPAVVQEPAPELERDLDEIDEADFIAPEYARGNWYKKRQLVKDAHALLYQTVVEKAAHVAAFENPFIAKKNALTQRFEEFSQSLGFARGVLYETIVNEISRLESARKPKEPLTQSDRIALTQIQENKNTLMQLKKDFDTVTELYKSVDQAMAVLLEQVGSSQQYKEKAFECYEKITQVLSDQVAEQLYAEIVAAGENIDRIALYISGDFSHYFDELSAKISDQIALISKQITHLKEQGVDLLNPKAPVKQAKPEQKAGLGFFGRIWYWISQFFIRIFKWFKGFFI